MSEQIQMLKRELSTDIYKELYHAFQQRDADKLEALLETNLEVDLGYRYGKPDYGTLLDICAMQGDCSKLIKVLLKREANPNIINPIRKKGPIHFASEKDDFESLRILVECPRTDVNLLDNTGSTALHYVTKHGDPEITAIKLLLTRNADVNLMNRKGKTPLHIAIECLNKEAVIGLIEAGADLSIIGPSDITLKEEIAETFPNINAEILENQNAVKKSEVSHGQLFALLRAQKYDEFIKGIKCNNHLIELNDGCHTFLQYCCEFGHANIVEELLEIGANPNTVTQTLRQTPLMLAGRGGHAKIIEMLIRRQDNLDFTPIEGETPLHCIVNGMQSTTQLESDYLECLNLILTQVPKSKLNINQQDIKGNTVLHYAAKLRQHEIVLRLLQNGAYIGVQNVMEEMACADVSYKTFLEYLDSCLSTNDALPREDNYEIIFNYECLLQKPQLRERNADIERNIQNNRYIQLETLPLLHIARNRELRPLLKHPIFTSFLHLKWHRIRVYFYVNLIFYLLFWIFLTTYILQIYGNKNLEKPISTNSTSMSQDNLEVTNDFSAISIAVTLLVILLLLRELFQLCLSPIKYLFNPENWLEIGIIIVTFTMLFSKSSIILKHQISAIGIMLSWAELVLLIGRHPALSTNIEMLKTVSFNFLKFLAWYSILIIAFALSFYSLFKDSQMEEEENFFEDPGSSVFKTVVMLTGEFDAGTIPFVEYPITSHVLFVLFVFLIAIVLFNLLNGLAVSDTQAIRSDAELVSIISRAKLISYLETTLANPSSLVETLTKCFAKSHKPMYTSLYLSTSLEHYTVRVLANMGCLLAMESIGGRKKGKEIRHHINYTKKNKHDPCPQISMRISMDPTIVERASQVLINKCERETMKLAKEMEEEKERLLRQELENFRHCINNLTEMFRENKSMLDNISKALASRG